MIEVHYFAGLRELAGIANSSLPWQAGLTVGQIRFLLSKQCPAIAGLLARSRIAVNDTLADDADTVPDRAEVALLPPVSGG